MQQGIKRGVHQGEVKVLRRLLTSRFGPLPSWVDPRLEQGGENELEIWAERVLASEKLEDVFDVPD